MLEFDSITRHMLLATAKTYGPASDPKSPENCDDQDFQAGYAAGRQNEDVDFMKPEHPIWIECGKRKLRPDSINESFARWKRGYWAGRYIANMTLILDEPLEGDR